MPFRSSSEPAPAPAPTTNYTTGRTTCLIRSSSHGSQEENNYPMISSATTRRIARHRNRNNNHRSARGDRTFLFGGSGSHRNRPSLFAVSPTTPGNDDDDDDDDEGKNKHRRRNYALLWLCLSLAAAGCTVRASSALLAQLGGTNTVNHNNSNSNSNNQDNNLRNLQQKQDGVAKEKEKNTVVEPGWSSVLQRAVDHKHQCRALQSDDQFRGFDARSVLPFHNDTVASLPSFGIVDDIQKHYSNKQEKDNRSSHNKDEWPVCELPPETECLETQFSVVFMAYNPDRLGVTFREIQKMLDVTKFQNLVHEIILVWNGERHVNESKEGQALIQYAKSHPVRIVYPLKMGFPNDLMNRYHPNVVQPQTKALLYYDDDGPFYSFKAIEGGFELWKRHAAQQVGAMARQLNYSPRQERQRLALAGTGGGGDPAVHANSKKHRPDDRQFVSHCTNVDDAVDYDFHFFANYDANMVLPSGSFLHSRYLCFLWHPVLAAVRQFVLDHPVHPDDMTVSMVVSQLAGRAPRVYSRRLNPPDNDDNNNQKDAAAVQPKKRSQRRRLSEATDSDDNNGDAVKRDWSQDLASTAEDYDHYDDNDEPPDWGVVPQSELQRHRSLMFSICWDCGAGMTEMKQYWAELRTEAVNALVRYFGSLNSGSIGWCSETEAALRHYDARKDGRCHPAMARQGWLPWMNPDGTPKETCP